MTLILLGTVLAAAFSVIGEIPVASGNVQVQQFSRTTLRTTERTITRTLPTLTGLIACAMLNPLYTDKTYYDLGETVTVILCYEMPKDTKCTADVATYHVIILLGESRVDELDVFHGSGTHVCLPPQTYEYGPRTNGPYTVQLLREGTDQPLEEARFQVGDPNGSAVGGEVVQVSSFQLFAPWIALSSIAASVIVAWTFLRKWLKS